jgi:hypothetical protein
MERTAVVTETALARRGLSDSLEKLFRALIADANDWTIAMCRKLQYDPVCWSSVVQANLLSADSISPAAHDHRRRNQDNVGFHGFVLSVRFDSDRLI